MYPGISWLMEVSKLASFSGLVPISYLLMVSGKSDVPVQIFIGNIVFTQSARFSCYSFLILGLIGAHSHNLEYFWQSVHAGRAGWIFADCGD